MLDNAYEDAQNKILGYYYVKRFRNGIKDWDFMHGGEAQVIPLGKMIVVSKNRYQFNNNGKIKTVKISDNYGVK